MPRAIDCWVNTNMGDAVPPEFLKRVAEDYFKRADSIFKSFTPDELVAQMDAAGVEKAIVTIGERSPAAAGARVPEAVPGPLRALRRGRSAPRHEGGARTRGARRERAGRAGARDAVHGRRHRADRLPLLPALHQVHRLELPISINTGLPGPPMPGACQDPMHLDEICYFLPELVVVMAHGADPWWNVAIRLMIKYKNLHLMTSAYAPKYFPPELIHFMNTRGKHKILFASDHPVLDFARCVDGGRGAPAARRRARPLPLRKRQPALLPEGNVMSETVQERRRRPHRAARARVPVPALGGTRARALLHRAARRQARRRAHAGGPRAGAAAGVRPGDGRRDERRLRRGRPRRRRHDLELGHAAARQAAARSPVRVGAGQARRRRHRDAARRRRRRHRDACARACACEPRWRAERVGHIHDIECFEPEK